MTDCLGQVRNDVEVTNEKLSALNTNSKSTRPKTKENEIVKHDNAEKSKKCKEKRVSNWTWDTVRRHDMVINKKAYLEVVKLYKKSVKLATAPDTEFLQNAMPKGNFSGQLKLKKAGLFANSAEKLVDKALDRMREKIKSFKSYAEYTNWYFNNYMIAGTVYNITVFGIVFKDIAFLKNTWCRF